MARFGITHHKAISVTSGYWIGAADNEREIINMSGVIASGVVNLASLNAVMDYGITGQSGHITSLSTKLTTISWGHVNNKGPLATANSGISLHIDWSGGAIDIYKYAINGSAATSSQVAWSVWGA